MNSNKVLLGILGGVAVGAIAGILFAPDKGSKTRKKITDKGKTYAKDAKGKFTDATKNLTNKYENFMEDAKELVDHRVTK